MCALASPAWNERLSGALAALALQAGLFALLLQSFPPLRRAPEELTERIFYLPRIVPPPPVIDARRPPTTAPAPSTAPGLPAPEIPPAPPPYMQAPPGNPSLLTALRGALACESDAHGRPSPLVSCQGVRPAPRNELLAPAPDLPVTREGELAAEKALANTPVRVPCVSLNSRTVAIGSSQEHAVRLSLLCALGELMR